MLVHRAFWCHMGSSIHGRVDFSCSSFPSHASYFHSSLKRNPRSLKFASHMRKDHHEERERERENMTIWSVHYPEGGKMRQRIDNASPAGIQKRFTQFHCLTTSYTSTKKEHYVFLHRLQLHIFDK